MFISITNEQGKEVLYFAPNYGVTVKADILLESPERVAELIEIALAYNDNYYLKEACQGGRGPLLNRFYFGQSVSFSAFVEALNEIEIVETTQKAKRQLSRGRRTEFQGHSAALALQMIELGIPYICVLEECPVSEKLTLDHIIPLSRGGLDELSNLRFLCRSHNSKKGDRMEVVV